MASLRFFLQERALLHHRMRGGRVLIGRADQCDVALPSEVVSRVHCSLESDDQGWWLIDRSRHGTFMGGARVQRARLGDGTTFRVGEYEVRFEEGVELADTTREMEDGGWEELVAVEEEVASRRVVLQIVGGPMEGTRQELQSVSGTIGGEGATVMVDPGLPADAARFRVARGRPMVERGRLPLYLENQPVNVMTPVYDGDTLRLGRAVIEASSVVGRPTQQRPRGMFGDLVGRSEIMTRLFETLDRIARHDAPVLLTGESGTGKELAARGLHDYSRRASGPFVAINCAAIPQSLAESQLFGHERGSFTGADERRDGAFQRAHRGTLFLDELGEMTLEAQARLLRALESGEVLRVGGTEPEYPDVRVIAATNRPLARMVEEGAFRRDLYYRLAVLTVRMPALREHSDDLPKIVEALLERTHPGVRVRPSAMAVLRAHAWPGNVRELRNVLTRAVVMGGDPIDAGHLQFNTWTEDEDSVRVEEPGRHDAERALLVETLARFQNNRTLAARALGIPRTSLLYKMMRYGLSA